ncbi:MAG: YkvA family protein [Pseudoxanthomonas sp.]
MSTNANHIESLPRVLSPETTPNRAGRRRRIGSFRLSTLDMERFNRLLSTLAGERAVLDCDQVVTAARLLADPSDPRSTPACIRQRLERADSLCSMLADRGWQPANETVEPASAVLGYLDGHNDLIPDWVPQVGRLDDAIVIETAWPRLAGEVLSYQDFCRLRLIEARLQQREVEEFRFDRKDWEVARRAEAALREHQRRVRESSYVPVAAGLFRIH